jgi:hypothetical protein
VETVVETSSSINELLDQLNNCLSSQGELLHLTGLNV